MRGTTFTKGKMNYFGSFSQQRTWAPLAQGALARSLLIRSVNLESGRQRAERGIPTILPSELKDKKI